MTEVKLNKLAIGWLKNGIYALAIAGLYSIILVLLRTPQLSHLFTNKDIFKSALIVHVNLSVLVWLLSMTCLFWSYGTRRLAFDGLYIKLAFVGMILMAIGPFVGEATPIMNNYVPMLENISFVVGLSLFGVAVLCFAISTLVNSLAELKNKNQSVKLLAIFKLTTSASFILVWYCFLLSYLELEKVKEVVPLDLDFYYELLFWSGGHLLQFLYTQSLMMALFVLFEAAAGRALSLLQSYGILFILNFLLGLAAFVGHFNYDIIDGSFKEFFTKHMIYAGGIVPVIFIFTLIYDYSLNKIEKGISVSLVAIFSSLILFLFGGLIGAVISGVNVTIPAHYHGSIVGISVALMGVAYIYCYSELYQNRVSDSKDILAIILGSASQNKFTKKMTNTAKWQLVLFTFGQILHITGLALAGGYGVLRKSPGVEIPLSAKIYMGMVGGGGLIAIIGGLMFVYICVKNLKSI